MFDELIFKYTFLSIQTYHKIQYNFRIQLSTVIMYINLSVMTYLGYILVIYWDKHHVTTRS